MGIHGMANLFENNEPRPDSGDDFNALGDRPSAILPPLAEGHNYELQKLPSGRTAVIVTGEAEVVEPKKTLPEQCGCGKYQSCEKCQRYWGAVSEVLDSPESRTQRHSDSELKKLHKQYEEQNRRFNS